MYDLSEFKVDRAKPKSKRYGLNDGGGLWLLISPSGRKTWVHFYRENKEPKQKTLGEYPVLTLSEAREALLQSKRKLQYGYDSPGKNGEGAPTFFDAVKLWHEVWGRDKAQKTELGVWALFKNHAFDDIGHIALDDLTPDHFENIAINLQSKGLCATARSLVVYSKKVFEYRPVRLLSKNNPVSVIKISTLLNKHNTVHRARLPNSEIPEFIKKIDRFPKIGQRTAMQLMLYFWVRTIELLGAKWSEFDFERKIWVVPAGRMKNRKEHIVPLSRQAIELLDKTKKSIAVGEWVFFPSGAIDKNYILHAIWDMGYKGKMTGHGFRGIASTALNRQLIDRRVIEIQLSHRAEPSRSAAAYNAEDQLHARIIMMQEWSDYIDTLRFS